VTSQHSRRRFVISLSSLAAASVVPQRLTAALELGGDAAPSRMRFGYAAITWGGNDLQAINDVGEVGFRGIQLRSPILKDFGEKPKALAELLKQHRLTFVALSGGGPRNDSYIAAEEIATQVKHATFMRAAGGLYLQMTDSARPKGRKPESKDFNGLGRLLTEIGKRTADLGIPMAYHNHMRSLGEAPDEVDALMDAADPRYVKLLLDVAHYAQGGGDPTKAIRKHRDRILFLHIKDVESVEPTAESANPYRFVELGRGRVDLPAVFSALREIKFRGWAIIELDSVPDKARTPKESAIISKKYLEDKLGMRI
jgi:inosose dehydratase